MTRSIHWFRQDLRIHDNPGLWAAAQSDEVLPVFIFHDDTQKPLGSASRCWLHHGLVSLNQSLDNKLYVDQGEPLVILQQLIQDYDIDVIHWNRCYEPWQMARDRQIKSALSDMGVDVISHNGFLLWEPWTIEKQSGGPYQVFTPFYRKGCLASEPPRQPFAKPSLSLLTHKGGMTINQLQLLPLHHWHVSMMSHFDVGEDAALSRLALFLDEGIKNYKSGRDQPGLDHVSKLSPYLHWGQLSPHQVWHAVEQLPPDVNTAHFLSELGWREFSYNLLYHSHDLPSKNWKSAFDVFPWKNNSAHLERWQSGQTGYPIVDAGMRQLWQTGWMHNRVRMIVASFLIKNCLIDWREGERWFWDCLLDADLASNSASWQWVAGCGADAAPFFRIFNPVTQAKKFDPTGVYIKRYVPELAQLPEKYTAAPWTAPSEVLQEAGIVLGKDYPKPIVDLQQTRQRALAAYELTRA